MGKEKKKKQGKKNQKDIVIIVTKRVITSMIVRNLEKRRRSTEPRVAANLCNPESVLLGARRGLLAGASPMKLISEPITPGPPS
jgi:hypothetical protein